MNITEARETCAGCGRDIGPRTEPAIIQWARYCGDCEAQGLGVLRLQTGTKLDLREQVITEFGTFAVVGYCERCSGQRLENGTELHSGLCRTVTELEKRVAELEGR